MRSIDQGSHPVLQAAAGSVTRPGHNLRSIHAPTPPSSAFETRPPVDLRSRGRIFPHLQRITPPLIFSCLSHFPVCPADWQIGNLKLAEENLNGSFVSLRIAASLKIV